MKKKKEEVKPFPNAKEASALVKQNIIKNKVDSLNILLTLLEERLTFAFKRGENFIDYGSDSTEWGVEEHRDEITNHFTTKGYKVSTTKHPKIEFSSYYMKSGHLTIKIEC